VKFEGTGQPPAPSLKDLKPFPVPANLVFSGGPSNPDQLERVFRSLDSYAPGPAGPVLLPFAKNDGANSAIPVTLESRGAAYFSLSPSPSNPPDHVDFHFDTIGQSGLKIRLFRVSQTGDVEPACSPTLGLSPEEPQDYCDCKGEFSCSVSVSTQMSSGGLAKELLAVASNPGFKSTTFSWRIGTAKPAIRLLDPITSHPAFIGTINDKRSIFVQLQVTGENASLHNIKPEDIHFQVSGCFPLETNKLCSLPKKNFAVSHVADGTYWAVLTLPNQFYETLTGITPLNTAALTLRASYEPFGGFALGTSTQGTDALQIEASKTVLQVVMSRSDSMADSETSAKLSAAKAATKLLLHSLDDDDEFGLVTFTNDAQSILADGTTPLPYISDPNDSNKVICLDPTPDDPNKVYDPSDPGKRYIWPLGGAVSPIPEIEARLAQINTSGSLSSIGDGVLEAQSNFIRAGYDSVGKAPVRLGVVIMSDGKNNAGYKPERYAIHEPYEAGYQDGSELPPEATGDPDPCDSTLNSWAPGDSGLLSLPYRRDAGLLAPTVLALGLGPDVNGIELKMLADAGQGAFSWSNAVPPASPTEPHLFQLTSAALQSLLNLKGLQHTLHAEVNAADAVTFEVEPRASALKVVVVSDGSPPTYLALLGPSGETILPRFSDAHSAIFAVPSPSVGTYSLRDGLTTAGASGRRVIDASVSSPVMLRSRVDVVDPLPLPPAGSVGAYDAGRSAGKPVRLTALLNDGEPLIHAAVRATVRQPGGQVSQVRLFDDGKHGDGAKDDGLYGFIWTRTQTPGIYRFDVSVDGRSTLTDATFHREETMALGLSPSLDVDGDGMPDFWEKAHGLKVGVDDHDVDLDGDGLTNLQEYAAGTLPRVADSDKGGENDGSELKHGRDPGDKSDDQSLPWWTRVIAGNSKVRVALSRADRSWQVAVQKASSPQGDFQSLVVSGGPIFQAAAASKGAAVSAPEVCTPAVDGADVLDCTASNQEQGCYRVRLEKDGVETDWSEPLCTVAREDVLPPRIDQFVLSTGGTTTRTRQITLALAAHDDDGSHDRRWDVLRDENTVVSGVSELQLSMSGRFDGVPWQPFTAAPSVWLPAQGSTTLFARVRDAAGNESPVARLTVAVEAKTALDQALSSEEKALDAMNQGQWAMAKVLILASLPRLDESIKKVEKRIVAKGPPNKTDVKLLVELLVVKASKLEALTLAKSATGVWARKALLLALEQERALAALADKEGRVL